MKKLYFIASLLISQFTFSQNFSYPVGQHIVATAENENYESYPIDINTAVPEAIQYKYELVSNTFPAGWSYSLCDYGNCYVGAPNNGTMSAITQAEAENDVIGWFKLNLTVAQYYGQGKIEMYVYDSEDYNRGDIVSWDISWNGSTASIATNSINDIVIYPNPTSDFFKISVNGEYNGSIFNSIGEEVKTISGTNTTEQSVTELKSGIYFVKVATSYGTLTKRLIIK